jgi:hypothetical protein
MAIDLESVVAAMPPGQRRHARRCPEIEAAVLTLARQGYPISRIAGGLGIPLGTIRGWARIDPKFGELFSEAVEEGLRLNTAIASARFLARGERRLRSLMPQGGANLIAPRSAAATQVSDDRRGTTAA